MTNIKIVVLSLVVLLMWSCSEYGDLTDAQYSKTDISIAVPIINTSLSLGSINDRLEGNTSVVIDAEGRPTLKYQGDIVRKTADAIFPAFPGINNPLPIGDNNSTWSLEELAQVTNLFNDNVIRKATFLDNFLNFYLQHSSDTPVTFTITIPEITLNGVLYTETFVVPVKNDPSDVFITGKEIN